MPRTVFSETEVEEAFRFFAAGKHRGKVLIQIRNEDTHRNRCLSRTIAAIPKIFFNPRKAYVITGGLGGVGLELADWMIRRGAGNLVLNSRSGITNGYQKICFRKWKQIKSVRVDVSMWDSSDYEGASNLIAQAEKLGPVGGIVNHTVKKQLH